MLDRDSLIAKIAAGYLTGETFYSKEYAASLLGVPEGDLPDLGVDSEESWAVRGRVAARELVAFATGFVAEMKKIDNENEVAERRRNRARGVS